MTMMMMMLQALAWRRQQAVPAQRLTLAPLTLFPICWLVHRGAHHKDDGGGDNNKDNNDENDNNQQRGR